MRPPSRIGSYELTARLGEGGAGSVFLARHPHLGYEVAIKVPLGGIAVNERHKERFAREADALAKLRHPGLVDVVDRGFERGQPWFAMRRVVGEDLSVRLERAPLNEEEAFELARQLTDAIGAAHAVGVLHRDLKPDNVIRTEEGRYVVTDFGLAKDLEVERSVELSKTGAAQGTPGYWAPEQALGGVTTPATDVYGIGATVYAALTGDPPVCADSFLQAVMATKATPPKPLSAHKVKASRLEPIVLRCLAKKAEDRFSDLASLRDALDHASLQRVRQGPSPWVVAAILCFALVGGSALTGALLLQAQAPPDQAAPSSSRAPGSSAAGLVAPSPRLGDPSALADGHALTGGQAPTERPGLTESPGLTDRSSLSEATPPELAAEGRRLLKEGKAKQGLARLNEAWKRGDLASGVLLGDLYHEGNGVPPDRLAARDFYRRAADRGYGPAMVALGRSLHLRHPEEARSWLSKAVRVGAPAGAYLGLADIERLQARVPSDMRKARNLYQRAQGAGAGPPATYGVALTLVLSRAERAEGFRLLTALALEAGHEDARLDLSRAMRSKGNEEERRRGLQLLREGAESGQGKCWAALGRLLQTGTEFEEPDLKAAYTCYANAVKLGSVEGMVSMALAFPDNADASALLQRAVALEHPRAQFSLGARELAAGRISAGIGLIHQAAAAKHPQALAYLGELYEQGLHVKQDVARGRDYTAQAAVAGDPTACHNLGLEFLRGRGPERDVDQAEKLFKRAADQGFLQSFEKLGSLLLERGESAEALRWIKRGAREGDPPALLALANALVAGKAVARNTKLALELYVAGAKKGHVGCAHMAGMMFERSIGTEKGHRVQDLQRAAHYYTLAAEAGGGPSMLALAEILADGRGVPKDPKASEAWFKKAIKSTSPPGEALFERAKFYATGDGLPHDERRAALLFERAAAAGHNEAAFQFGILLCKGTGVPKDYKRGAALFAKLCESGHQGGTLNYAVCLANGTGVEKDVERARSLFHGLLRTTAPKSLHKAAREALRELKAEPSPPR